MYELQWKKIIPDAVSTSIVRVGDGPDAAVVAGASVPNTTAGGTSFVPGVYDPTTQTCIIRDDNAEERDFYVLVKNTTTQLTWVPGRDGQIPVGAIQCGYDQNGEPLYVGRFDCDGRLLCGKVNRQLQRCDVRVRRKLFSSNWYEVLCLQTVPFGFSYSSSYNLRSQPIVPITPRSTPELNGSITSKSWPFTPASSPVIVTRSVTSSETNLVTVRKTIAVDNGIPSILVKDSTPEPKSSTPEPIVLMPEPKASTPEPKASTPEPIASTPEPIASTPEPMDSTAELKASTPEPMDSTLETPKTPSPPAKVRPSPVETPKTLGLRRQGKQTPNWLRKGKNARLVRSPLRVNRLK